jgi:hypothetical protein
MIVRHLDIVWTRVGPPKANPKLIVDADRVLPSPIAFQTLEPIARWYAEGFKSYSGVEHTQLATGNPKNIAGKAFRTEPAEHSLSFLIPEPLDRHRIVRLRTSVSDCCTSENE